NKITMVDFWASWCGPCRLNNPVLRQLYADFHSKGLEIVNVSLDEKRDRWVEAVKQDKLVWTQVSSLKGWKDPVTQLYSITAIPAIFVLDADNNIIASGLHGEELKNFVSGLFAEKGAK
ncbi:MAG: TlpA family protein disulfide reductase, partial [Prevotella nanceiensis]|nr:TlpA family protein disulfide reductase [Hoylesella nanceiensis]